MGYREAHEGRHFGHVKMASLPGGREELWDITRCVVGSSEAHGGRHFGHAKMASLPVWGLWDIAMYARAAMSLPA